MQTKMIWAANNNKNKIRGERNADILKQARDSFLKLFKT